MKKNIQIYYNKISNDIKNINFDISTILMNAKLNKTFHKLLQLCINYDIKIVDISDIRNTIEILNDIDSLKKYKLINYKNKIKVLVDDNNIDYTLMKNIEDINVIYKKELKDIEVLTYLFKDIYTSDVLRKMCYIKKDDDNLSSSDSIKKPKNQKKSQINKYIAEYIN